MSARARLAAWLVVLAASVPAVMPAPAGAEEAGGTLFFMSDRDGGHDLFRADLDGSNAVNITNTPGSGEFLPAFSPNGSWLVFSSDRDDPDLDLYVMAPDGTGVRRITDEPGFQSEPAWCKGFIFFTHQVGTAEPEIGRVRPDGTGFRLITDNDIFDAQPACNPDGEHVTWVRDVGGFPDLVQARLDGSRVRNLTRTPDQVELDPAWSPSGDAFAYVGFDDAFNLAIFTRESLSEQPLHVFSAGPDERVRLPRFHPDGAAIDATLQSLDAGGNVVGEHVIRVPMAPDGTPQGPAQAVVDSGGHDAQAVVQPRPTCEVIDRGGGNFELRVTGTSGADDIFVREPPGFEDQGIVEVVLDSRDVLCVVALSVVEGSEVLGQITTLVVDGREGDDHLTVSLEVPLRSEIRGGGGRDTLQLGTLDEIHASPEEFDVREVLLFGADSPDIMMFNVPEGACPCLYWALGGDGADTILSNGGGVIEGGGGPDTIKVGDGSHEVDGGKGDDVIEEVEDILGEIEEVIVPARPVGLGAPTGRAGDGPGDVTFDGGPGRDRIVARGGDDRLRGGSGDDTLRGGGGSDNLDGEAGADALFGGKGDDTLRGGPGAPDTCDGGPGLDRIFVGGDTGCESFS